MQIRQKEPLLHEVRDKGQACEFQPNLRCIFIKLHDHLKYFIDQTVKEDILLVKTDPNCPFRTYEIQRVTLLFTNLTNVRKEFQQNECNEDESAVKLNKYLLHNKLNQFLKLRKPQKVEAIKSSFYRKNGRQSVDAEGEIFFEEAMQTTTSSESEKDDSDDEVLCVIGSDSEVTCSGIENGSSVDGNIEEEDTEDCADEDTLFTRTRTGRMAGSWRLSSYIGELNTTLVISRFSLTSQVFL